MKVTRVTGDEGMAALRERWRVLLEGSRPNHPFMTLEWVSAWWRHFGDAHQLWILAVEEGGEVIGILPWMLDDQGGDSPGRYLRFLGHRKNDWMDVIAIRKEPVLRAALEYLREHADEWDHLDLQDLEEGSDTIAILTDLAAEMGLPCEKEQQGPRPHMATVEGWDEYYGSRKKLRLDIERQARRLKAAGELTVTWPTSSQVPAHIDALFRLHQKRQEHRQQNSMFSSDVNQRFYRELGATIPVPMLECPALMLGDKVIAIHFGFRYAGRLYHMTPTFDPDFVAYGPGKLLLRYVVENCFSDPSVDDFDFLFGSEPYKYEWATGDRHGWKVRMANVSSAGWIGKVFRRIPAGFRRRLIAVRKAVA